MAADDDMVVHGVCEAPFAKIRHLMEGFIKSGEELGASIVVNVDGKDVVDLWGGYADEAKTRPWDKDTIVNVFSCTKNFASLAVLVLVQRGLLDVDEKVSRYWPEFAANGKQDVLVRHLISHTAGLPGWQEPITIDQVYDLDLSTERLAAQAPCWPPGTASGYHALTMGHLVSGLVRRVTGMRLRDFLAAEIAGPLGADFQIGAAEEDWPRVADVISPPVDLSILSRLDPQSLMSRMLTNPPMASDGSPFNTPAWRGAELGAGNGHGNARSMARVMSYISLGGARDGTQLLSKDTIDLIFQEQANGTDLVLGLPLRFGIGFGLTPTQLLPWLPEGKVCYWLGIGGSYIVMDLDRRLTIAYAMNKMEEGVGQSVRGANYGSAVYEALAALGNQEE